MNRKPQTGGKLIPKEGKTTKRWRVWPIGGRRKNNLVSRRKLKGGAQTLSIAAVKPGLSRGVPKPKDTDRRFLLHVQSTCTSTSKRTLASSNFSVASLDGSKRLCHIRGKMHKKVWIAAGDIILAGLLDYQDDKVDIIFKYMPDEARLLKAYGELPENIRLNEGIRGLNEEDEGGADDYIEFEDEDIDKI
ncbi:eukaryotic translation initiation factor 1A-like [Zingiber officinale]|nr:eukaryotic translation initiation factor 1A-like [Zingiber officinale]